VFAHPHRLKEVVYTLSNHNQNVMAGLWKDLPYKVSKKVKENWVDALFLWVPVIATYECVPFLQLTHHPGHARGFSCSNA
jgi:Cytochrome b-c1 complex subunit 8